MRTARARRLIAIGAIVFALVHTAWARNYQEASELAEIFKANGVGGAFVLFERETDTMLVWNEARAKERFAPARGSNESFSESVQIGEVLRSTHGAFVRHE